MSGFNKGGCDRPQAIACPEMAASRRAARRRCFRARRARTLQRAPAVATGCVGPGCDMTDVQRVGVLDFLFRDFWRAVLRGPQPISVAEATTVGFMHVLAFSRWPAALRVAHQREGDKKASLCVPPSQRAPWILLLHPDWIFCAARDCDRPGSAGTDNVVCDGLHNTTGRIHCRLWQSAAKQASRNECSSPALPFAFSAGPENSRR